MAKNYFIFGVTVLVVGVAATSLLKSNRIPLPPELEKERQEAEEVYELFGHNNRDFVLASESSSPCSGCASATDRLNLAADARNTARQLEKDLFAEGKLINDLQRQAIQKKIEAYDKATDDIELPSRPWHEKVNPFSSSEEKIYDIVLPEDFGNTPNPNKIMVPEEKLGEFRKAEAELEKLEERMREHLEKRYLSEKNLKLKEEEYAAAIAEFNSCKEAVCKKEVKSVQDAETKKETAGFSTSILDVRPIEKFKNGTDFEFEPNIYNRQKLGPGDLSKRIKFQTIGTASCGRLQKIAWWESDENNAMGLRWYKSECPGQTGTFSMKVTMTFDGKVFAVCEYVEGEEVKECQRLDK